jgi:hypothetical protein
MRPFLKGEIPMEKPREIANAGIEPARMFQRTFFWQPNILKE